MKKGITRIVLGTILISLQALSIVGGLKSGYHISISTATMALFLYDLIFLVSYLLVGIIGIILLISGLFAYNKKPNDDGVGVNNDVQDPSHASRNNSNARPNSQTELGTDDTKVIINKFCSRCGSLINPTSMQCSGCGKQYFKRIRVNRVYIGFMLMILALTCALLFSLNKIVSMEQKIYEKDAIITELYLEIQNIKEESVAQYEAGKAIGYDEGYAEGSTKTTNEERSVICSKKDMLYHNVDRSCGMVQQLRDKYGSDKQYLYLTLYEALQLGYKPCNTCY